MDLSELSGIVEQLPPWLQIIVVGVLVVAGVFAGRRATGKSEQRATSKTQSPSTPTLRPTSRSASGGLSAGAPLETRDLTPGEIAAVHPSYDPHPDGDADPGEIVWTWVPFVEYDGRGKDRPVLIIARQNADTVIGCYLSTKEHRGFLALGTGAWDGEARQSYLNPQRLLTIHREDLRREGAVLDREQFESVTERILREHVR